MRVLFGFLLNVAYVSAATLTQQYYSAGTPTLGGCTGAVGSPRVLPIGPCVPATQNGTLASIKINDCWSNGLFTMTRFIGTETCNPAFATELIMGGHQVNNQSYCNVGNSTNGPDYTTYTCSDVTIPQENAILTVVAYPKLFMATSCAGQQFNTTFNIGKCNLIPKAPGEELQLYTIPNCVDGLVVATLYSTSDCSVGFNQTTKEINTLVGPFGPWAQAGALSAVGKPINAPGSSCANTTAGYAEYVCGFKPAVISSTGTTSAPGGTSSTAPPVGTGSSTGSKSSSTGNGAVNQAVAGMAALLVPIMAALF